MNTFLPGILRLVKLPAFYSARSMTKKTHSSLNTCQGARLAVPAINGGYRALGYNYRQNGTILDLISYDPYRGIEITF